MTRVLQFYFKNIFQVTVSISLFQVSISPFLNLEIKWPQSQKHLWS